MNCGLAEIGGTMKSAAGWFRRVDGYVFYHSQDLDRVVDGEPLLLAFGSRAGDAEGGVGIGRQVVQTLRSAGLEVTWDGTFGQRIAVRMEWRKRRRG